MRPVRVGVIGVGYFGTFHAEKYVQMPTVTLVGVADRCGETAERVATRLGTRSFIDERSLLASVEAVSIAVPGPAQAGLTLEALRQGCHVLVEKPMALDLCDGRAVVSAAESAGRVLQVGYLERFNPVFQLLQSHLDGPRRVEARRLVPFTARVRDVDVIFDLMVHDIDLVLSVMGDRVRTVAACGARVVSTRTDVAWAILRFEGGGVAQLYASRVTPERVRCLRIHQPHVSIDMDLSRRVLSLYPSAEAMAGERPPLKIERGSWEVDALEAEISAFIRRIRGEVPSAMAVTRGDLEVLAVAERISQQISRQGCDSSRARARETVPWQPRM